MSYKGYSFNLHEENDRDLIDWLSNKKVTQTIKTALRNHMKLEDEEEADNSSIELLSAIKRVIENNKVDNIAKRNVIEKEAYKQTKHIEEESLSEEDAEDFDEIFDI